jgi:hypothetical protein
LTLSSKRKIKNGNLLRWRLMSWRGSNYRETQKNQFGAKKTQLTDETENLY